MTTFALIPGGGGDPWEWHLLAPELERRGHTAMPVRLPAEDDAAGWSEYAQTVIDAVRDRDDVTLVAASMGGFTAPIVAARRRVKTLVLVNAMIPLPGETFNDWWSTTGSNEARRAYHERIGLTTQDAERDDVLYYHDQPPELLATTLAHEWSGQSSTPLGEPWPLAAWPDVPIRVISGRDDRMFPLEFQRRNARERLGLEIDPIDGGHMVALGNPIGLATLLER